MTAKIFILFIFSTCFLYSENLTQHKYETNYGEFLNYQKYTKIVSQKKVPLILFLHGAGERGWDNKKQTVHVVNEIIHYCKTNNEEMVLIAPQCPPKQQWVNVNWSQTKHSMPEFPSTPLRLSFELIQHLIHKHQIDHNRIYIIGLSMGGYGTWDAIQRKPDFFAAAIPICGGGDIQEAKYLTKLPIWAWHGDKDKAVPVKRTRDMIKYIQQAGGQPIYNELAGIGHNAWTPAAKHEELWKWMFSQSK